MTVYLVGAGPGDPGLLTVRGAEVLRRCDVVVHDRLIERALLDLAPACAQRIDVGKSSTVESPTQAEINRLLVEHGRAGRAVVRLKGGDPFVFGRGGEEAQALADAGVPFECVPGVSSAIAAPAAAGIPLTLRNVVSSFTVVTGRQSTANTEGTEGTQDIAWASIAAAGGTIVLLMAAEGMPAIAQRLRAGGLAADTPVAVIRWATTARQEVQRATLATVGALSIRPPATIVIGTLASIDFRQ